MKACIVCCGLAVALVCGTGAAGLAATIDQSLSELLASKAADEVVSTLVYLEQRVDIESLNAALDASRTPLAMRHETVVRALQDQAQATQGDFAQYLENLQRAGRIKNVEKYWIVNAFRVDASVDEITKLAQHPAVGIIYYNCEIELIAPVKTGVVAAPNKDRTPENGVQAVRAPEVWALGFTGEGVLTATLDTGVDGNHPALASRWRGVADPRYAGHPQWAWFDPRPPHTTFPQSFGSHGTHTMGTVCGGAPGDQIGVAPGCQWIHAAVIDRVDIPTTVADAILAFQWLVDPDGNPATTWDVPAVCSNSWGVTTSHGYPPCDPTFWTYIDACEAAGIVVIFSAGNEGPSAETLRRPGDRATDGYNALAVGAVNGHDAGWPVADFSSRGPSHCGPGGAVAIKPELAAPGVAVRSSVPGGGYESLYWDGTSMASPHVNGVIALIRQACPDLSVNEVKQVLYDTAVDLGPAGKDNNYGYGMVDAYAAVQLALSMCSGAPRARDSHLQTPVNTPLLVTLQATDYDELPDPPGALTYIVTSLPTPGNTLADAGNGHVITSGELPYSLVNYGSQILYTPLSAYYGTDTFQFKANDGGVPPDGGDSNIATVDVLVLYGPPVITTDTLPPGMLNGLYGPATLQASAGQPELTWTVLPANQYFETDLGSSQFAAVGIARGWHADDSPAWAYTLPFAFPFFGIDYTTVHVCANGFINFDAASTSYDNSNSGLIAAKRIAAMWDDLRTDQGSEDIFIDESVPGQVTIRWAAETYTGAHPCNFAITLMGDGRIQLHYGSGNTGLSPTIGISNGDGVNYVLAAYNNAGSLTNANSLEFVMPATLPDGLVLSPQGVLSGVATEAGSFSPTFKVTDALNRTDQRMIPLQINIGPVPPIATGQSFSASAGVPVNVTLQATDDGVPNPPGALSYIIATLPPHGFLSDPGAGVIVSAPYTLVGYGNVVVYHPSIYYAGPDSFTFRANDGGTPPDGGDSLAAAVSVDIIAAPQVALSFPLDSTPGWTTTGLWAFGKPNGLGSHAKDPANGYTGTNVYGYNLSGDYTNNMPARYLTTTALNCAQVSAAQLKFWRWLGVEQYDHANVAVSSDATNWTTLWDSFGTTFNEAGWSQQSYDIHAVADRQATVYLRWGMGTSDATNTYPGWNIDDIEIWGVLHPVIPGDLNCDGSVNFRDINPFVLRLSDPPGYAAVFTDCPANGDTNGDGSVNFADINSFVTLLTGP